MKEAEYYAANQSLARLGRRFDYSEDASPITRMFFAINMLRSILVIPTHAELQIVILFEGTKTLATAARSTAQRQRLTTRATPEAMRSIALNELPGGLTPNRIWSTENTGVFATTDR